VVYIDPRHLLGALGAIESSAKVELVSATLEPLWAREVVKGLWLWATCGRQRRLAHFPGEAIPTTSGWEPTVLVMISVTVRIAAVLSAAIVLPLLIACSSGPHGVVTGKLLGIGGPAPGV
jgi:hypothetical protein